MSEQRQVPVAKFKAGPVSCALWENRLVANGKTALVMKASISKAYKDRNGQWSSTSSFNRDEIPLVMYCLQKAYAAMIEQNSKGSGMAGEEAAA
ncbi:MAG TPA: hypothetical protein PKY77_27215 [Phycisphaerae bacterium]|nr:hypothetical protein [Phycisphaerae bacterium]HRY71560.1 hypothetical protein [Phycisphaerae bacterium]HSA25679.1 hypothetical protein [Phycisphaerae bacterium]